MADCSGYPPLSGSLGDLTIGIGQVQARHEFDRASSEAALADWARRWGPKVLDAFSHEGVMADELEEAQDAATKAERVLGECDTHAKAIQKLVEDKDDPLSDRINALAEEIVMAVGAAQ